jgi:leader peptidase (prepilin peptidase) / N-methyltransferase
MTLDTIFAIFIFFFGAIIGSFLNVVILRYRSGRTIGGRSACMTCSKVLTWHELIPIGSFLTQRGKCVKCKTRISWQYPIVEAITGFLFVLVFYRFEYLLLSTPILFALLFAFHALLVCILIILSVYDIKHKILPDKFVFLFASLAVIGMFLIKGDAIVLHFPHYTDMLAGILLPVPFTLIWYFSKGEWMGLGDAKLMIGIGFLLGFSKGTAAILISFWIGAIVSIVLLVIGKCLPKKMAVSLKTAIPFGPFLALGTIIVLLTGFDTTSLNMLFVGGM